MKSSFFLSGLFVIALSLPSPAADAVKELGSFSAWKDVSLERLANGPVQASKGTAMAGPRELAVEMCYVVPKSLAKTIESHLQWSPMKHPELKVYLHGDLSTPPKPADFQQLGSAPINSAVKAFIAATQKLPRGGDLQLSAAEAKSFGEAGGGPAGGALPPPVSAFWSKVLLQRADAFSRGGLGALPPYDAGMESIRPAEETSRLLKSAAKIRGQFSSLIQSSGLAGGKPGGSPAAYWELFNADDVGALALGAMISKGGSDTWQGVDVQYYASSGYYVFLTFYQMWPVTAGGREATLVWRGDLISAGSLAELHGVERMGASSAMMRELQKVAESMKKDASK